MNAQLGAVLTALTTIIGATIAVCLGHIDVSTYIALVGPVSGAGLGAGLHAAGASSALVTAAAPAAAVKPATATTTTDTATITPVPPATGV